MRRAVVLALALALGCDQSGGGNELVIQLVTATSDDPVAENGPGRLSVRVEQEGGASESTGIAVESGFDVTFPIATWNALTRISARFDLRDATLIGAVPFFDPFAVGLVRIPVGQPSSCHAIRRTELLDTRLDPTVIPFDSGQHWVIGGLSSGASGHTTVGILQPVYLTIDVGYVETRDGASLLPQLTQAVRRARSVLLDTAVNAELALVVGDVSGSGAAFTLLRTAEGYIETPVAGLDPSVGAGSTLVDLAQFGAAIVGGGDTDDRSRRITWIDDSGAVRSVTQMIAARTRPAAVFIEGGLLIAGGQADGEPEVEFARFEEDGAAVMGAPTALREAPVAIRPPASAVAARGTALVLGGADASGAPLTSTLSISGCPTLCTVTPGPADWARPRLEPTVIETRAGTTWILGGHDVDGMASDAWDRVSFPEGALRWDQDAMSQTLDEPRAHAAATEIGHGVIALLGGESGPDDPLVGFEMCWPAALEGGVDIPSAL